MTRRLKVLLVAAALSLGVLGFSAPTVAASCSQAKITLYANPSGGGSALTICYALDIPNLNVYSAGTDCGFVLPNWNDCASSVFYIEFTVNTAVCLWTNNNYGGNGLRFVSNSGTYNLTTPFNNSVTSIEWGNNCLTD